MVNKHIINVVNKLETFSAFYVLYKIIRAHNGLSSLVVVVVFFFIRWGGVAIQTNSVKAETAPRRWLKRLYDISEPGRKTRLMQK